jgi:peptidoglycan L-alanyl-D-glutamate endopeptidase CwlK
MAKNFLWSLSSKSQMKDIHPDLRRLADLALELSPYDFRITDGKRTRAEQKTYVAKGASQTLNSRHLYGFALDYVAIVNGKARYELVYMKAIADAFKKAANKLDIPINWGGDWKSFKDTPHIELAKGHYPDDPRRIA